MRELKFRVWSSRFGMHKVGCLILKEGAWNFEPEDKDYIGVNISYGPTVTIEQDTGIYDKNGRMIYEGDIIKMKYPYDRRCIGKFVVVKDPNSPRLGLLDKTKNDEIFDLYKHMSSQYKIIGDIHHSPDLLDKDQPNEEE